MTDHRQDQAESELVSSIWDPEAAKRCIVCNRPSGGKAICNDVRCAIELANG